MTEELKQAIQKWIHAGCEFRAGLELYVKAVGKRHATVYVLRKYSPSNHRTLITALTYRAGLPYIEHSEIPKVGTQNAIRNTQYSPKKLRDDYTFLNQPGVPNELKILVSNKITAYHAYKAAHAKLFDSTTPEEEFANVRTLVENYIDNHVIHLELAHYRKNQTILGKHPIFEEMKRLKKYRHTSSVELFKQKKRIEHNIWRIRKLIDSGDKPNLRFDREQKIKAYQVELAEIEKFIGD